MMDFTQLERNMLGDLWVSPGLWESLVYLCDTCNGRFAGTEDERRAGDYLISRFQGYGLENAAAEPFEMSGWQRGEARFTVLEDGREIAMPCLALPGTPGCDLEAEIVDAKGGSAEDYAGLGGAAAGKIVLTSSDSGPYRSEKYLGAVDAGAAAFIFGGAQPGTLAPTGSIDKDLPGIGLAFEHVARVRRALVMGPVRGRLSLTSKVLPVTARNIVAELPGNDPAEGWILACGHYDGHDVAQGAQDNAAGTAVLLEAARLLAPFREHLKAGIRFVLFSGEELGLYGSYAYAKTHTDELDRIRLVFNADVVAIAMPLVLQTQASPELADYLRGLPLKDLDATVNDAPKSLIMNSDHFPFTLAGVSGVWALTSVPPTPGPGWIHTQADTLDKLDLRMVRQTASTAARLLLRMAAEPAKLPRGRKSREEVQKTVTDAGFEKALRISGRWPF